MRVCIGKAAIHSTPSALRIFAIAASQSMRSCYYGDGHLHRLQQAGAAVGIGELDVGGDEAAGLALDRGKRGAGGELQRVRREGTGRGPARSVRGGGDRQPYAVAAVAAAAVVVPGDQQAGTAGQPGQGEGRLRSDQGGDFARRGPSGASVGRFAAVDAMGRRGGQQEQPARRELRDRGVAKARARAGQQRAEPAPSGSVVGRGQDARPSVEGKRQQQAAASLREPAVGKPAGPVPDRESRGVATKLRQCRRGQAPCRSPPPPSWCPPAATPDRARGSPRRAGAAGWAPSRRSRRPAEPAPRAATSRSRCSPRPTVPAARRRWLPAGVRWEVRPRRRPGPSPRSASAARSARPSQADSPVARSTLEPAPRTGDPAAAGRRRGRSAPRGPRRRGRHRRTARRAGAAPCRGRSTRADPPRSGTDRRDGSPVSGARHRHVP